MSDVESRLQQVRQSYLDTLPAKVANLRDLWADIQSEQFAKSSHPRQEAFFTLVHSLGGSGATFGFNNLTNTAKSLEYLINQIRNTLAPEKDHITQITTLINVLDESVQAIIEQPGEFRLLDFTNPEDEQEKPASTTVYLLEPDTSMVKRLAAQIRTRNFQTKILSSQTELQHDDIHSAPLALIIDSEYLLAGDPEEPVASFILNRPYLTVICLSHKDDITTHIDSLRAGADFFITKPFGSHTVINILESLVEQQHESAYRVLIIDDDQVLATLYAGFLEQTNITTCVISDPLETLETIKSFKPELILLDIHMQNVNGFEIARLIRQIPDFDIISIVFMSSEEDVKQQLIAINHVGDFLKKPVWPEHLITTVLSKCRHSRKLSQTQNKLHNTLREYESQRLAMDQHSIISITDAQGNITYINHMFCNISGRDEAELLGENHRLIKSDEHNDQFYADLWNTISKGDIWHGEIRNKTKNGGFYWVESTIVPFLDEKDIPYQYIAICTDITKIKTAEIEQQHRQQRLLEQNTSLAILTNKEKLFLDDKPTAYGKITEFVAETLHIARAGIWFFNDKRDTLICEYLYDANNDKNQPPCFLDKQSFPVFLQTLSNERIVFASDAHANLITRELRDKYLLVYDIHSIMAAGIYSEGNCIGIICCEAVKTRRQWWPEDKNYITTIADYIALLIEQWERQAVQDELITAKERAEKASNAKSDFLSRMSHELRTPLNAIIGFSQLMHVNPENMSAIQKDNIKEILNAGRHLLGLINEILDFSSIEAGKIQIAIQPVEINPIVNESIQLVSPLTRQKNIEIINNIPAGDRTSIRGDCNRVKQVMINLLSNAIKYNIANGKIFISLEIKQESVSVIIEDTGYGIPPEKMEILFQPFERSSTDHPSIEGTGIGLVISKSLIELMRGTIGCSSTVGSGSKFWIELPSDNAHIQASSDNM